MKMLSNLKSPSAISSIAEDTVPNEVVNKRLTREYANKFLHGIV